MNTRSGFDRAPIAPRPAPAVITRAAHAVLRDLIARKQAETAKDKP